MLLSPGAIIAQRYELGRLLGAGGMGEVWSGKHLTTQEWVALKFLKGPVDPELTKRFVREARAAAAVQHPNVIGIHNVLMLEEGLPVMVMDLLDGESLAGRLARSGPIPVSELVSIMVPVLSAVGAAHALGIVHRDLKPDNIFLAQSGDGQIRPIVLDFGICKLSSSDAIPIENSTLTVTGSIMGTPCYMAPEQLFGEKDVDARADVWALGVILYECTTGTRPVQGDNVGQLIKNVLSEAITPVQELAPHVPPEFSSVVQRMLISDRAERAPDLRQAFETLSAMSDVSAESFGAATTMKVLPSQPAPDSAAAVGAGVFKANSAVSLVGASVPVRTPRHSRALLLGGGVGLLVLGGILLSFSGTSNKTDAHPTSSPVLSSQGAALPLVSASATPLPSGGALVAMTSSVSAAPPVSSRPTSDASPSSSAKRQRIAQPKPAPRMLSGGVRGTVPF